MTRSLPCSSSQPSAPGLAGPKKSPARSTSTRTPSVRRRAQPPLQLDADRALAGDGVLRRVLADRRAGVGREVVDAGRERPAARRRPWRRRWRCRPSAAPCPSSCGSRAGWRRGRSGPRPPRRRRRWRWSIASPFTHSIGVRGPSLAAAATGSRASARTRQPCLISAWRRARRTRPVAPMIEGGAFGGGGHWGRSLLWSERCAAARLNEIAIIRAVDIHIRMDSWDHYRSLLAVLSEGSLSGAARQLGLTQPTVGRHIEALETELGAALFTRSAGGLRPPRRRWRCGPTPRRWRRPPRRWRAPPPARPTRCAASIRITASDVVGVEVLPPILAGFHEAYPEVAIELAPSNRQEDLLRREADIAVRMVRPTQGALLAKRVGAVRLSSTPTAATSRRTACRRTLDEPARSAHRLRPRRADRSAALQERQISLGARGLRVPLRQRPGPAGGAARRLRRRRLPGCRSRAATRTWSRCWKTSSAPTWRSGSRCTRT